MKVPHRAIQTRYSPRVSPNCDSRVSCRREDHPTQRNSVMDAERAWIRLSLLGMDITGQVGDQEL